MLDDSLRQMQQEGGLAHSGGGLNRLANRVLGWRYECKYLISEAKAAAISQFIEPYIPLDRYSKLQPTGSYPIVSLYLDSPNLHLCRESLEGRKNRFKLRIRSYTDDTDYPRFCEIKRRANTVIIKSRARIKHHDIPALFSGLSLPHKDYSTDERTFRQFQLYMKSINAGAVVRVRYRRRAYEAEAENRLRLTFDRQLYFNVGSKSEITFKGSGWQRYPLNGVILEIKFTGRYPAWLSSMVKCFGLRQQSLSKYARSVKRACSLKFCAPELVI